MTKIARSWWGEKFIAALEECIDSGRLSRGRSYSSPRRLSKFNIKGKLITGTIEGNINPYFEVYEIPYYKITIELEQFSKPKWEKIITAIGNNAAWLSKLLMNEMPDNIESAFRAEGLELLPTTGSSLTSNCSCPDWANPCKHVAGVYYKVASLLDRDPFLLFQLRGMEHEKLQQALAKTALGNALLDQWRDDNQHTLVPITNRYTQPQQQAPSILDWHHFWQNKNTLPELELYSDTEATLAILIKKGGDYPLFWHKHDSFIEVMEVVYDKVLKSNKQL